MKKIEIKNDSMEISVLMVFFLSLGMGLYIEERNYDDSAKKLSP